MEKTFRNRIEELMDYTAKHNGGTFSADTLQPLEYAKGYSVSLYGYETNVVGYLLSEFTKDIVKKREMAQGMPTNLPVNIGTWISDRDGLYCIDLSVHVESLTTALSLAVKNNQIAIFDHANAQEIRISDVEQALKGL